MEMLPRGQLEAFLEIVDHGSLQAAGRATGRSRATYGRLLAELESTLGGVALLERSPGQRAVRLTPAGAELEVRARSFLARCDRWVAETRDALVTEAPRVRVGAVGGSFDLIADLLGELAGHGPDARVESIELPGGRLVDAVLRGEVDLGFGPAELGALPADLAFEGLGPLTWSVIVPAARAAEFPASVPVGRLEREAMIVTRSGPAREVVERCFARAVGGPFALRAAHQVESTPRIVDLVARGLGVAIVSGFRIAFLPPGVVVRALEGGPAPLVAGVLTRRDRRLGSDARWLLARARARFEALTT
jgi:DNA-binding transcriptional LysR family regulator